MEKLDNEFISKLETKLKSLPSLDEDVEREERWMTAEQIKKWFEIIESAEDIDQFICDQWQLGNLKNIRPAKHPHRSKLVTLWGHIDNVWRANPSSIQLFRLDEPMQLEDFDLPDDAPKIFISYSSVDIDLVLQLRKQLASKGIQTWLYISEIKRSKLIFENVSSGIENSVAAIGFITRNSIGSAWVYSELETTVMKGKRVYALFDACDYELMQLLKSFVPEATAEDFSKLIKPLVDAYLIKGIEHNITGYGNSIVALLNSLHHYSARVMFPNYPEGWEKKESFIDFSEFIQKLLRFK